MHTVWTVDLATHPILLDPFAAGWRAGVWNVCLTFSAALAFAGFEAELRQ
jgi:hypothetical protein